MRRILFIVIALGLVGSALALPSYYGYRGIMRVVDARPITQGGIAFGLISRYGTSTDDFSDLVWRKPEWYPDPAYIDTLDVRDKEHVGEAMFTVAYGLLDYIELGARLQYNVCYYERDMIQPRGLHAGRWDGVHGLGDAMIGFKAGFAPISGSELLWLGLHNWWSFAPSTNETVLSEDYCGRWFDDRPMWEMRRPRLSTGHTSYGVGALVSFDFAEVIPRAPLRLHLNCAYTRFKQSFSMWDFRENWDDSLGFYASDSVQVNLTLEENALDFGGALEMPTQFAIIFTEFSMRYFMDREVDNTVGYFTPGIRFITKAGAMMDISFDLGVTSFDPAYHDLGHDLYQQGSVTPAERLERSPIPGGGTNDWTVGFTLAFSSDLISERPAPTTGTVSGVVTSVETGEPVQGTISFPGTAVPPVVSDPTTGYYTVVIPEGSVPFAVSAEGYLPASATVVIQGGTSVVKDFQLELQPSGGAIAGTVTDQETGDPVVATISFPDIEDGPTATTNAEGVYQVEVPAGTWTIKVEAEDYLPQSQPVVVLEDQTIVQNFQLRPALVEGQVLRFSNIYFDVGSAQLKPESYAVLDGIVATLMDNPNARVQIAGHTDSDGSTSYNQTLSEQRAASVFSYLVQHGVPAANLTTIGFGESQPYVPNTSAANKAQNRRIEFTVLSVN
jgi:outer membrane protein OmpA-like peptidoglycan-associated protein